MVGLEDFMFGLIGFWKIRIIGSCNDYGLFFVITEPFYCKMWGVPIFGAIKPKNSISILYTC